MTKGLSEAISILPRLAAYFFPPHIEVVENESKFGRLNDGRFALLLKVKFRNEGSKPTLVRSLQLWYEGTWHTLSKDFPEVDLDSFTLLKEHGRTVTRVRRDERVDLSPHIPPSDVVERYAIFVLPEPRERWPTNIRATVKAFFPRRVPREVPFTLQA